MSRKKSDLKNNGMILSKNSQDYFLKGVGQTHCEVILRQWAIKDQNLKPDEFDFL